MHATEAVIPTPRASRYLVQLAAHLDHLRDVPHSHDGRAPDQPVITGVVGTENDATVTFDGARGFLHASADSLTLRLEGADTKLLRTLQLLLTHRLQTISRRDDLRVDWQPALGAQTRTRSE